MSERDRERVRERERETHLCGARFMLCVKDAEWKEWEQCEERKDEKQNIHLSSHV